MSTLGRVEGIKQMAKRIATCSMAVLVTLAALLASGDVSSAVVVEEYVTCPASIRASVTQVPGGWQQVPMTDRLTLNFDSVDVGKMNGKPAVICNYGGTSVAGSSIYKQMPPTYSCSKTTDPRQVRCSSIIKTPKE